MRAAEDGMGRELEWRMTGEWRTLGRRGRRRSSDGDEQGDVLLEVWIMCVVSSGEKRDRQKDRGQSKTGRQQFLSSPLLSLPFFCIGADLLQLCKAKQITAHTHTLFRFINTPRLISFTWKVVLDFFYLTPSLSLSLYLSVFLYFTSASPPLTV